MNKIEINTDSDKGDKKGIGRRTKINGIKNVSFFIFKSVQLAV